MWSIWRKKDRSNPFVFFWGVKNKCSEESSRLCGSFSSFWVCEETKKRQPIEDEEDVICGEMALTAIKRVTTSSDKLLVAWMSRRTSPAFECAAWITRSPSDWYSFCGHLFSSLFYWNFSLALCFIHLDCLTQLTRILIFKCVWHFIESTKF